MKVVFDIEELAQLKEKGLVLTIGVYDGVHRGHQKVITAAKAIAAAKSQKLMVITFSNHPQEILSPSSHIPLITTLEQRLALLETFGCDIALVLTFSKALANKTANEFLTMIDTKVHITDLVLGYDATLGSNQDNNRQQVKKAAEDLEILVHYIDEELVEGCIVSSRRIRHAIAKKDFDKAETFLGHTCYQTDNNDHDSSLGNKGNF